MEEFFKMIEQYPQDFINSRFVVNVSKMDNGVNDPSFMMIVRDVTENGFTLRFFNKGSDVAALLSLLKATK